MRDRTAPQTDLEILELIHTGESAISNRIAGLILDALAPVVKKCAQARGDSGSRAPEGTHAGP